MKNLSKYIESVLDGEIPDKLKVVKDSDTYFITITKRNINYHHTEMGLIELSNSVTVRRILGIYFPNDGIIYKINHIFV